MSVEDALTQMRRLIPCSQSGQAPMWPGQRPTWAYSRKVGVGTALGQESLVWFSLARGVLTEVYYPTVDCPNLKELKFIVLSPDGLEDEEEMEHVVESEERSLLFHQINTSKHGRFRISKTTIAHPHKSAVLIRMKFEPLVGKLSDYQLFLYLDPHIKNSGLGDTIFRAKYCKESLGGDRCGFGRNCIGPSKVHDCIVAQDDDLAMALATTVPWQKATVGYVGTTDGQDELKAHLRLQNEYTFTGTGNVAGTVQLSLDEGEFTVALGFGSDAEEAASTAFSALEDDWQQLKKQYCQKWEEYCRSLDDLGGKATPLYYRSAMVLRALEDKLHPGAMVASLSIPWGEAWDDWNSGGYHLVWARDLYHVAMAFIAMGDRDSANRALEYMLNYLQKEDGSIKQNTWVDGRVYWDNVQMDQVAYPLLLAWWLKRDDLYSSLKKAGDYLLAHGPYTPQERWEENSGYSPSTMAAQIAGLVCLAQIATKLGELEDAKLYLEAADSWQERIEKLCLTKTGPLAAHPYFLRVCQTGDPNCGAIIELANGHARYDEREIIDAGFLELVRLGVRSPKDPAIVKSLKVVDQYLGVDTPRGRSFYRYTHDGYGEPAADQLYRGAGKGRLWPVLTGERGHLELALGNKKKAKAALLTMERFANTGQILSEQVWEHSGEGTGSATPLAWSHAEYVRLLVSYVHGKVMDCPPPVAKRYLK
jgi:glucoamylase